jgi:hypothetical protein
MPVDPSVLMKYDPRPGPERPRKGGWGPLIVAGAGTLVVGVFFLLADGDDALGRAFIIGTVILGAALCGLMMILGYQEDGVSGLLYAYRHPLGSELSGEGPPSWMRLAWGWVLVLSAVLSFVIAVHNPKAVPWDWVRPRPSSQQVHDLFLK